MFAIGCGKCSQCRPVVDDLERDVMSHSMPLGSIANTLGGHPLERPSFIQWINMIGWLWIIAKSIHNDEKVLVFGVHES